MPNHPRLAPGAIPLAIRLVCGFAEIQTQPEKILRKCCQVLSESKTSDRAGGAKDVPVQQRTVVQRRSFC